MNILILGAASFIGKNLIGKLSKNNTLTIVDKKKNFFDDIDLKDNVSIVESTFDENTDFDTLLTGQDIVYHLVSTVIPATSNQHIKQDIENNVIFSSMLFDSCVKNNIKKVIFISSGGAVYGKEGISPLSESTLTKPITSYGIQKVTIENLLYLYNYMYGLDYKVVRLANPYGPYQRPNGGLGAVTAFTYKALNNEEITVYGDGSVVRDYIYIDDAITGILNIADDVSEEKIFNLGSGNGTSIKELLDAISMVLNKKLNVTYKEGRTVDVPINYLDMSKYINTFGKHHNVDLKEGISLTANFLKNYHEKD